MPDGDPHLIDIPIESSRLILNRHILARRTLVLAANEVGDLLVLGLLDGALVVLRALTHELLLDVVDALVQVVLVLLALWTSASCAVGLVHDAVEEAAASAAAALLLLLWVSTLLTLLTLLLVVVVVVVSAAEGACRVLEEVHGGWLIGVSCLS
ncbi:hypothetical protein CB0940_10972 [Cercospora beticola]|uniref:Uncharacterized protein n=1 Tax=Cercospora beticola TaxID=122368 RepID=A0A2G5HDP4_CERBT|nr:hypothetical protein CB0940_10972 [Cercospora beticola]PIA90352.1 hypothetical protein CB0940_10972 [Cercospora beticola]